MMRVRVLELSLDSTCEQWEETLRQASSQPVLVMGRGGMYRAIFTAWDPEAVEACAAATTEGVAEMERFFREPSAPRSFPLAEEQAAALPPESDSSEQAADGQQPS